MISLNLGKLCLTPLDMKRTLLTFLLGMAFLQLYPQAIVPLYMPPNDGGTSANRAPNGTTAHTTMRAHLVIPASEITANLINGNIIKALGFVYSSGVPTAAGGQIKMYLQNTSDVTNTKATNWATAITGMQEVYNGNFNLPIATGVTTTTVTLTQPFTYTGGGLYVAYDYVGTTFTNTAAVYSCNYLGLTVGAYSAATTSTTAPTTLASTNFRPQMIFGIDNPYQNDISVTAIETKGQISRIDQTQNIVATIKNSGSLAANNVPVSINITGANLHAQTLTIPTLAVGSSTTVTFNNIALTNTGTQTIALNVPNDQNNNNNTLQKSQEVSCDKLAFHSTNDVPYNGIGFNGASGILVVKYQSTAIPIAVNGTALTVYNDANNIGKQLSGVILNAAGSILAESTPITLSNAQIGTQVSFPFNSPVIIPANTAYYIGIKQFAATPGYYPIATVMPVAAPADRAFSAAATGGTFTPVINLGTPMVAALIAPHATLTKSTTGTIIAGTPTTFTATANFSTYHFKVNGNSVQNNATNTYTYNPIHNDVVTVEAKINGCTVTPDAITMQVSNPLPIQLLSFTLRKEQQKAQLYWQTASETNNKEFIISRSADGQYYTEIKRVPGAGDSQNIQTYRSTDPSPYAGLNYYKLQQLDLNGKRNEVAIKTLDFSLIGSDIQLYPNPVKDWLTINFAANSYTQLQVFDLSGKLLYETALQPQNQSHQVNIVHYPKGTYVVTLKGNNQQQSQKVMKE
jgi:hypothetical protein